MATLRLCFLARNFISSRIYLSGTMVQISLVLWTQVESLFFTLADFCDLWLANYLEVPVLELGEIYSQLGRWLYPTPPDDARLLGSRFNSPLSPLSFNFSDRPHPTPQFSANHSLSQTLATRFTRICSH